MNVTPIDHQRRRSLSNLRRFDLRELPRLMRAHPVLSALLATIVLMEVVHGIEMLALFPLYLSEVERESAELIALSITTYLLVDMLMRTPAGWLADRLGRKPILLSGIVLSAVPLPLMLQTQDQTLFMLLNGLNGLGAGCIWPCIYASIADQYGRGQRGLIFGLVNTVMLGGLASGPISGNLLIGLSGSFVVSFLFCFLLVISVLFIVARFVRETKAHDVPLSAFIPLTVKETGRAEGQPPISLQLIILFAIVFCLTLSIAFLVPILSLYGKDVLRLTPTQFALTLALPALATAIALIPFGHIADHYGRKRPLALGLAIFAFCLWLTPISIWPPLVSIGATIGGLGYALAVPSWNALAMDHIPQSARGTLLGFVAALQGAGLVIGPNIGAALWDQVSPFAPFLAAALVTSIGAALSPFVHDS